MSTFHLDQLHHTLTRLEKQSTMYYSTADKQDLQRLFTCTFNTLHNLYPVSLSPEERERFIAALRPLEQQFLQVTQTAAAPIPLASWQAVHKSLRIVTKKAIWLLS
jgi:hypothetical protein